MPVGEWRSEVRTGPAHVLHASWPSADADPRSRAVAVCEVDGPCVVLGSTQPEDTVDALATAHAGVEVVRRRTGGGAVYVDAVDPLWVDVWVPAGDRVNSPDVGRSFDWLGDVWVAALRTLGIAGLSRHRGPAVTRTRWSPLVCFGGIGRGEVVDVDGRKVVGLAQRRTRFGSWYQCACPLRWDPAPLVDLLSLSEAERTRARRELAGAARGVGEPDGPSPTGESGRAAVISALLDALP